MNTQHTFTRSLHDVGLATWFGGALMGAVGLNRAAGEVDDPTDRGRVANAGWSAWGPVNAAAIGSHLLGGLGLIRANKGRLLVQREARWVNGVKAGATLAALAATAYARRLGAQVADAGARDASIPVDDATTPAAATPDDAAAAQRTLDTVQWVVPAATGALLVLNAKAGEQQRPAAVWDAVRDRLPSTPELSTDALPDVPWAGVLGTLLGLAAVRRLRRRRRRAKLPRARDIMTADPVCVSEHDTLGDAAQLMLDHNIGALPVTGADQRLTGMLTDRDIVTQVVARGANPVTMRAGELRNGTPVTIDVDDLARDAVKVMAEHQVRRLPVTDGGRLVGIVSQADVARSGDDDVTGDLVQVISQPV